MTTAFGAQVAGWHHWISMGMGYGAGLVLLLIATALITKSYYSRDVVPAPLPAEVSPILIEQPVPLLDSLQIRALELSREFSQMLDRLPPCPEINLERSYGMSSNQVAKVLEEELQARNEWEEAASRGYVLLACALDTLIDDFAGRKIHEEHLDKLRNGALPREEFVQVPRYVCRLLADSLVLSKTATKVDPSSNGPLLVY